MYYLYVITAVLLLISLFSDRKKTWKALRVSAKKFIKILPAFLMMLLLVSLCLTFLSEQRIAQWLGTENKWTGMALAGLIGSIAFMPGFITFPLCGILLEQQVPYMVLSSFSTTMMMVGIVTWPIEQSYFGFRATALRNAVCLLIALLVSIATGVFFREIIL